MIGPDAVLPSELAFAAAFAFCVVLLLLNLRGRDVPWKAKALLTLASLAAVFAFHRGLVASLGWPVGMMPTCTMLYEGADVREPGPDSAGIIYLWFVDADEMRRTGKQGAPRSVSLPYEKATHRKLAEAAERAANGIETFMRFADVGGQPSEEQGSGEGRPASGQGATRPAQNGRPQAQGELDFLPPPRTEPEKATPH